MFFIYPPFIWGLVLIYNESAYDSSHIITLYINLILLVVIALICYLLIIKNKLHIPSKTEMKYLLFGFTGNVVMYFYTFQNLMKIDNVVTVYLALLIVLSVYYLLLSKKLQPFELWLLLPIFLVYDFLYVIMTGCGFASYDCVASTSFDTLLIVLYVPVITIIVLYYAYRVISYKMFDFFKIMNIILVTILSIAAAEFDMDEKFILTLGILYPFFLIVDFIVKIVNKTYHHKLLLFYVRTFMIFNVFTILGASGFMSGTLHIEALIIMVAVTYVSLGLAILKGLLHIKVLEGNPIEILRSTIEKIKYVEYKTEVFDQLDFLVDTTPMIDEAFILVLAKEINQIHGYITIYTSEFSIPLGSYKDGYIESIQYTENNKDVLSNLLEASEKIAKSNGINLLRVIIKKEDSVILHELLANRYLPVERDNEILFIKKL